MLISGLVKHSFVDYPGKISAVVFTPYCNMRCEYCHNKHLLSGQIPLLDSEEVYTFLRQRRGLLDGVVISGGEPTASRGILAAIDKIRAMGYFVKLDTNGTNPDVLQDLLAAKKLDYIAMDIKAPIEKYPEYTGFLDYDRILRSIDVIKSCGVDYEFRTTFEPRLTKEDLLEISDMIAPYQRFYLQQYRKQPGCADPHPPSYLRETAKEVIGRHKSCDIRGL